MYTPTDILCGSAFLLTEAPTSIRRLEVALRARAHKVPWGVLAAVLADEGKEALVDVLHRVGQLEASEGLTVSRALGVVQDAANVLKRVVDAEVV